MPGNQSEVSITRVNQSEVSITRVSQSVLLTVLAEALNSLLQGFLTLTEDAPDTRLRAQKRAGNKTTILVLGTIMSD